MHILQALIISGVLFALALVPPFIGVALLPLCACWVAWDAKDVPPPPGRSFLARPSLVLFFSVLLFWPVVFPWYLAKHLKHRADTQLPGPPASSSKGFDQQTPVGALAVGMAPAPEVAERAARRREAAIHFLASQGFILLKVSAFGVVGYVIFLTFLWSHMQPQFCNMEQGEAKNNLTRIYSQNESYKIDNRRYAVDLRELGFTPSAGNDSRGRSRRLHYEYKILKATELRFVAEAVRSVPVSLFTDETREDRWTIDETGRLTHVAAGCP